MTWSKVSQPCPCGRSSDAYAIDTNGNGFCFRGGCGKFFKNNKEDTVDKSKFSIQPFPHRGLTEKTLDKYGVIVKFFEDKPFEVAFKYPNNSFKIRPVEYKSFRTLNGSVPGSEFKEATLFGKNVFDKSSKRVVTITEGEYDAMSVFQMIGDETAAVSVRGASSAKGDCKKEYEFLNSFEKIVICFDNDSPGQAAAKQVASLFDFKKVFNLVLDRHKDANAYLQASESKEFFNTWRSVKRYTPDNILSTWTDFEEAIKRNKEQKIGDYPFEQLQSMLHGIHAGEVIVIKGDEGIGKQLPVTTPIPTPDGFKQLGDLVIGDTIYGADGKETKVTFITEEQVGIPCYELQFADGSKQIAGGPHRWGVYDTRGVYQVKTTEDILNEGVVRGNGEVALYSVPITKPVQFQEKQYEISPYLLGYWLGDGNSHSANITVGRDDFEEFKHQIDSRGFSIKKVTEYSSYSVIVDELPHKALKEYGLLRNKHIPDLYKRGSVEQRTELLRGLMDSDGSVSSVGCEFYSSNKSLAYSVLELIRSLGFKARIRSKQSKLYGVDKQIAYTIWFLTDDGEKVFSFRRKISKVVPCKTPRLNTKTIRSITPVDSVPSKCLTVDNEDHLYLCGDHYTVTHNTEIFRAMQDHLLRTTNIPLGIIHLEEDNGTTLRGIASYYAKDGSLHPDSMIPDEEVIKSLKKATGDDESRIFLHSSFDVEDEDAFTDNVRFLVAGCGCKAIFLDHISWLATGGQGDDERMKLDRISQRLKLLAKELGFAMIQISHVNDEGKTRGSRNITKVANTVIHLTRDKTNASDEERNKMYIMVEKARLPGAKEGPAGYALYNEEFLMLIDPHKEPLGTGD